MYDRVFVTTAEPEIIILFWNLFAGDDTLAGPTGSRKLLKPTGGKDKRLKAKQGEITTAGCLVFIETYSSNNILLVEIGSGIGHYHAFLLDSTMSAGPSSSGAHRIRKGNFFFLKLGFMTFSVSA